MQYGFLKGRSTVLQLLSIIDEWTSNLDSGGQIDCIYMDFEKAFLFLTLPVTDIGHRRPPRQMPQYIDSADTEGIEEVGDEHLVDVVQFSRLATLCRRLVSRYVKKVLCFIPVGSYGDEESIEGTTNFGTNFPHLVNGRGKSGNFGQSHLHPILFLHLHKSWYSPGII